MFEGRRRSSLKQAIDQASDTEIKSLRVQVSERQERVAELELELLDARNSLAVFERELAARIRPLEDRLRALQQELRQARHRAERRAQWGDRLNEEGIPDVVEQFRKAWAPGEAAAPPPVEAGMEAADQGELKRLFRELAKRFHPDLTTDPQRKSWRQKMMAQVNQAYAARDLAALRELARQGEEAAKERVKSREQILTELASEIRRLDALIYTLQGELDRLLRSESVQLQLEASIARRNGRDLLGEMAAELTVQIAEIEAEIAALG